MKVLSGVVDVVVFLVFVVGRCPPVAHTLGAEVEVVPLEPQVSEALLWILTEVARGEVGAARTMLIIG